MTLRVGITGKTGQLVRSVLEESSQDLEVITCGRPDLDLSKPETVMSSFKDKGLDAIINAAAYTLVDQAEIEPVIAMDINCRGAEYVAMAAAALDIPLLHISTDYVFDGNLNRPYKENDVCCPANVYGRSKLAGEERVRSLHQNHVILRTAWIYSPFGRNFLKTMLNLSKKNSVIGVVDDQFGNPTSAIDIAKALNKIIKVLVNSGESKYRGTYHLVGAGDASWAEFAQEIFSCLNNYEREPIKLRKIKSKDYPTLACRPHNSRLDTGKLKEIYGIELPDWRKSVFECVKRIIEDEKEF